MRIVIAGAGEVGLHLSKLLSSESHDITLIDNNQINLKDGENYLDIKVINGDSSSPKTLKKSGVSSADLVIGVTASESVNLLTCFLSKNLGAKRTIARINNAEFIEDSSEFDLEALGVDAMISPENLASEEVKLLVNESGFTNSHDFEDGALKMIERAKKIDPNGNYIYHDLIAWEPSKPFDIIHSMEVIYYFNDPKKIICHMKDKWLKPNGKLIMGLDFYKENNDCHNWPKKLNTKMTLLSIKEWTQILKNCGLEDIKNNQTNSSDSFEGTLILYAKKLN